MEAHACVECGTVAVDGEQVCPVCGGLVVATTPEPSDSLGGNTVALLPGLLEARADDAAGGLHCPHCDAPVDRAADGRAADDCRHCGKPVRRPADTVHLSFTPGPYAVAVHRGEQVMLGRDAALSPHAAFLATFENISRRHASVRLDGDGRAWIRDEYSTNWTLRNGTRLTPGHDSELRDGDRLRLGVDLIARVRMIADPQAVPGIPMEQPSATPDRR